MSLTLDGTLGLNSINIGANIPGTGAFTTLNTIGNVTLGDASGDTVTLNSGMVTLNNSTTISAASTKTLTLNGGAGSNGLVIDASNNVGLGVTPGSWASSSIALQIGLGGAAEARDDTLYDYLSLTGNARLGSGATYYYVGSSTATRYRMYAGQHDWYTAASGTAGNAISFTQAMTLTASGDLGIGAGASSPLQKLDVRGRTGLYGSSDAYQLKLSYAVGTAGFWLGSPSANALSFYNDAGTERMRLDSSGNLGLGVTPSAWRTDVSFKAIQTPGGSFTSYMAGGLDPTPGIAANAYVDSGGTWRYINSRAASWGIQNGGAHYWYTAASGTAGDPISFNQAMTLTASGNLGIGTSSPASPYRLSITGNGSSVVGGLALTSNGNTAYIGQTGAASADCEYWNAANGYVRIGTNNTERARITAAGDLLVGTPSPLGSGEKIAAVGAGVRIFSVQNNTNTSGYNGIGVQLGGSNCNNTSTYHFTGSTPGINQWYLYGNGTSSFTSDERKKKNIETTRNGYLEDLCKLRVVKYNWWTDDDGTPKELGLIAQEVEQIFPGLITNAIHPDVDGETYKVMKGSVIPFMLLKAIQELTTRLEALEAR